MNQISLTIQDPKVNKQLYRLYLNSSDKQRFNALTTHLNLTYSNYNHYPSAYVIQCDILLTEEELIMYKLTCNPQAVRTL